MPQTALYNRIGKGYNSTRKADPYITQRLLDLLSAKEGDLYVDIGCGTGNYTHEFASKGINIYGVEPSENMLEIAKQQSGSVKWLLGSAENIPVKDALFDGCTAILTIHHWTNLKSAFLELKRVLKSHGQLLVFTSTPEQMQGYWLNHYFPEMMARSICRMPAINYIEQIAIEARFSITSTEKYAVQPDLQDHFLYSGKLNPSLYFEKNIRMGISSFASLANRIEVKEGLSKLRKDIDANSFENIQGRYENNLGDYLFILFEKID